MDEKAQISGGHLWAMTVVNTLSGSLLLLPTTAVESGGRAAWMVAIWSGVVGFLMVLLIGKLSQRFPGMTVVGYAGLIAGRWTGKATGLLFAIIIGLLTAGDLRLAMKSLIGAFFVTTPTWVLTLLLALAALSLAWHGIVHIARLGPLALIILIFTFLVTFPLLWRWMQPGYLIPVLDLSPLRVADRSFWASVTCFRSGLLLVVLLPYVAEPRRAARIYGWAFWVGWLSVLPAILAPILVFSAEGARALAQPFPYVMTIIRLPNFFFERMEILARIIVTLNELYTTGTAYFVGGLLIAETLGTRTVRPFMVAVLGISLLPATLISAVMPWETFAGWTGILTVFLTLAVFAVFWTLYWLRGLHRRRRAPEHESRA